MLNDYRSLNITKLDVLSDLPSISVGVAYEINGRRLPNGYMPSTLAELASCKVVYETVPGWKCDISKVETFEGLPSAAKDYIALIEKHVGVPVSSIGVGAGRNSMIFKN